MVGVCLKKKTPRHLFQIAGARGGRKDLVPGADVAPGEVHGSIRIPARAGRGAHLAGELLLVRELERGRVHVRPVLAREVCHGAADELLAVRDAAGRHVGAGPVRHGLVRDADVAARADA